MEFIAARTNAKKAMEGADMLVTATSAQAPLLHAEWVKPGAFYSHIGGWEDEYEVALHRVPHIRRRVDKAHLFAPSSTIWDNGMISGNWYGMRHMGAVSWLWDVTRSGG